MDSLAQAAITFSHMHRLVARFFAFSLLALAALAAPAARAAEAEFLRIWPQWQDSDAFERIGEFFGRGERHSARIVMRTQLNERSGYYFLVRVKSEVPLAGGKFVLQMIRSDAPDTKEYPFELVDGGAGEVVYQLGLTGRDWPAGREAQPVAWKLTLHAADGRVLAEQKSFLWEQPAK